MSFKTHYCAVLECYYVYKPSDSLRSALLYAGGVNMRTGTVEIYKEKLPSQFFINKGSLYTSRPVKQVPIEAVIEQCLPASKASSNSGLLGWTPAKTSWALLGLAVGLFSFALTFLM